MDKYLIVQITDILGHPMINTQFGEYKSLDEAKENEPSVSLMPFSQYVIIQKGNIDSNGVAETVKIVHLF